MHFALGKSYTYIDKYDAPEDFARGLSAMYGNAGAPDVEGDLIYALVTDHGGENIHALYTGQAAFIMNENGKTFANVSRTYEESSDETLQRIVRSLRDYKFPEIFHALKAISKTDRHDAFLDDCIKHFTPIHPEHDVPKDQVTLRNH